MQKQSVVGILDGIKIDKKGQISFMVKSVNNGNIKFFYVSGQSLNILFNDDLKNENTWKIESSVDVAKGMMEIQNIIGVKINIFVCDGKIIHFQKQIRKCLQGMPNF